MKFSLQFEASQFPEWRKKYLRYASIRQHINNLFPKHSSKRTHADSEAISDNDGDGDGDGEDGEVGGRRSGLTSFLSSVYGSTDRRSARSSDASLSLLSVNDRGDQILTKLLTELHKIDDFYRKVESELETGFKALQSQINIIAAERDSNHHYSHSHNQTNRTRDSSLIIRPTRSANELQSIQTNDSSASGSNSSSTASPEHSPNASPTRRPTTARSSGVVAESQPTVAVPVVPASSLHPSYWTGAVPSRLIDESPSPASSTQSSLNGTQPVQPLNNSQSFATTLTQPPTAQYQHPSRDPRKHGSLRAHEPSPGSHTFFSSHFFHPLHPDYSHHRHSSSTRTETDLRSALQPLKSNFIHLLRRMTMLIHYVDINIYALTRLLKTFEARSGIVGVEARFARLIETRYVSTSRKLEDELIPSTYQLFADYFEHGDVERARVLLLNQLSEAEYDRTDTFLLGLKIGVIVMLIVWNIMILIKPAENMMTIQSLASVAPIYRATGLFLFYLWLWGLAVAIFDHYRISYVFVFQLNPRNRLTHFALFNESANMTIVYLVNALLLISHYEQALDRHISYTAYPLSLLIYFLFKLFTPSKYFAHWETRRSLLVSIGNVIIAPFGAVKFRESYVGDVLTSMVKLLVDLESSIMLGLMIVMPSYAVDLQSLNTIIVPLVCCAPLWFRFMQCLRRYYDTGDRWPHFANAMKYAVAHSVIIVSAFHPTFTDHKQRQWAIFRLLWLVSTVASTIYTFVWDVTQDWGLSINLLELRPTLLFQSRAFYYWAIVSNFFLRFGWAITLVPVDLFESVDFQKSQFTYLGYLAQSRGLLIAVLAVCELIRRFQWTLLRVEWEQIHHGSGFRLSYYPPMFFQQRQSGGESPSAKRANDLNIGLVTEVVGMVLCVVVIAVAGATL